MSFLNNKASFHSWAMPDYFLPGGTGLPLMPECRSHTDIDYREKMPMSD
jgi:hypothetical protein